MNKEKMLTKSDLMYMLPEELIAQTPPEKRGTCRLLVVNRTLNTFNEIAFPDIVNYIKSEDTLVLNDTKVIPARIIGKRKDTTGKVEFFLLEKVAPDTWQTMIKPGRQCRKNNTFLFENNLTAKVIEELGGARAIVHFNSSADTEQLIAKAGSVPIPPYIKRNPRELDSIRYQTVYAKNEGAVAAPTAGLHFTSEILDSIRHLGTTTCNLTLHVGPGTFQPLRLHILEENTMEAERYIVSPETLTSLRKSREANGKIIAVGTTATRALESIDINSMETLSGKTSIFIYPPYQFRNVDMLLTNFHLPGSSLISLVGSFAGLDLIMRAYKYAIEKKFMFYSYGDAMLII